MELVILVITCALLSDVGYSLADRTTTFPSLDEGSQASRDASKSKLLKRWEKIVKNMKNKVDSIVKRLSGDRISCNAEPKIDNYFYKTESTDADPEVDIDLMEAGPSNVGSPTDLYTFEAGSSGEKPNTNCVSNIDRIPDSLSSEEMKILRSLERQNEKIRSLRERMNLNWPKAEPPLNPDPTQRPRPGAGLLLPHWTPRTRFFFNLDQNLDERGRLEQRKAQLIVELDYLESMTSRYRNHIMPYIRSRHQQGNEIAIAPGRVTFEALHEGHYDNMCNRMTEARQEVNSITRQISDMNGGSQRLTCDNPNRSRSEK
ncbi:hypothetical protein QAD02_000211 [Eretmocerus hayati]|uniref:Uncharacterized protein n=1 Tax=Eretmocerus hayati TaxID=131215 RepID=A0ACC2NFC2_9HYME|nr:hypothetical protein QAD02_000211 [Eretmocerus hayati]